MSLPKFKTKTRRNRRKEALFRLRQRWERDSEGDFDPSGEPVITPALKVAPGGIRAVLEALRAYSDEDARTFIRFHDSITRTDRIHLKIEEIAYASGVGTLRFAEVAQSAMLVAGRLKTSLLLAAAMPVVMKSTIKAATDEVPITAYDAEIGKNVVVGKTSGDVKAMEMFHKMSGMMPLPKGAQIAMQFNLSDQDQEKPALAGPLWKTPEERLREIQDMIEPKRLPSPESKPVPLGGHIDQMQTETVELLRED
jgi:Holliday junction resolvasome RuvABC endonuclease subunit